MAYFANFFSVLDEEKVYCKNFAFSRTDFSIMLNAAKVRPEAQERIMFEIAPLQSRLTPPSFISFFAQSELFLGVKFRSYLKFVNTTKF